MFARRGLSPRMLALTSRYGTVPHLRQRRKALDVFNAYLDGLVAFGATRPATSHGRSRRDGTRP